MHPYVKRIGDEGNEACAFYAKLAWMVDPFHIAGHKVIFVFFCTNSILNIFRRKNVTSRVKSANTIQISHSSKLCQIRLT